MTEAKKKILYGFGGIIIFIAILGIIDLILGANSENLLITKQNWTETYMLRNNGTLILQQNGAQTCNTTVNFGAIYFNGTSFYSCDGTGWTNINTAAAEADPIWVAAMGNYLTIAAQQATDTAQNDTINSIGNWTNDKGYFSLGLNRTGNDITIQFNRSSGQNMTINFTDNTSSPTPNNNFLNSTNFTAGLGLELQTATAPKIINYSLKTCYVNGSILFWNTATNDWDCYYYPTYGFGINETLGYIFGVNITELDTIFYTDANVNGYASGTSNLTLLDVTSSIGNYSYDKQGIQNNMSNINLTANSKATTGYVNCTTTGRIQNISILAGTISGSCTPDIDTDTNNDTTRAIQYTINLTGTACIQNLSARNDTWSYSTISPLLSYTESDPAWAGNHSNITGSIGGMNTSIANIKTNVTDIILNITSLRSNVTGLQTNQTDILANISSLRTNVTGLQSNMTSAIVNISNVNSTANLKLANGTSGNLTKLYYQNNITAETASGGIVLQSGAFIGSNSTCQFILYNSTGGILLKSCT